MSEGGQEVIKKRIKAGHGGAHGGAWKVAYADFVTAMMAFFLLMWLLNAANEETRKSIADYFDPSLATVSSTKSAQPKPTPPPPEAKSAKPLQYPPSTAAEAKTFDQVEKEVEKAVQQEMKEFSENIQVEMTPEGLAINIVDTDKQPMFKSGSATLPDSTLEILKKIAEIVKAKGQNLSIDGHTDAVPMAGAMTNWELSAARALSARRALERFGIAESRVWRVNGQADKNLLVPSDPTAATNRRISVVLLKDSVVGGAGDSAGGPAGVLPENFGRQ